MIVSEQQAEERIIGYGAREHWLTLNESWTDQCKESFLYRLDVFKPLSVDVLVLPSVIKATGNESLPIVFSSDGTHVFSRPSERMNLRACCRIP
jgi:hypothetical protein